MRRMLFFIGVVVMALGQAHEIEILDLDVISYEDFEQDARYEGRIGGSCSYRYWHEATFKKGLVKSNG